MGIFDKLFRRNKNVETEEVEKVEEKKEELKEEIKEEVKVEEQAVINDKGEEVAVEEEQIVVEQDKKSHKGMTRGEIMEYEMTRISDEMNALQADVQQYQEKKAQLKAYQEKLEKLEKLNNAGLR